MVGLHNSKRLFCCVGVVILWSTAALARDYYVAKTGSDTNPGTLDQPFLTIQRAASVMVAGDTAYIRSGVYRETVRPANSGAPGAPMPGLTSFTGSVQITSTTPIVSLSLNFEAAPAFSSLPPGELETGTPLATGR